MTQESLPLSKYKETPDSSLLINIVITHALAVLKLHVLALSIILGQSHHLLPCLEDGFQNGVVKRQVDRRNGKVEGFGGYANIDIGARVTLAFPFESDGSLCLLVVQLVKTRRGFVTLAE